jgi:hypothetical protein
MYAEKRRKLIIYKIEFTCKLYSLQYKINKISHGSNDMDLKYLSHNCIFQTNDCLQVRTIRNDKATAPTFSKVE